MTFGPGGTTLAIGYNDGSVRLWDAKTEKTTEILPAVGGARVGVGVSALAFGPGGTLAVGAPNSDVYLWPAKG